MLLFDILQESGAKLKFQVNFSLFGSRRSQLFFKIDVLENFPNFTGKHLCWSLFLMKLQAFRCATLLKRESNTGVFWTPGRADRGLINSVPSVRTSVRPRRAFLENASFNFSETWLEKLLKRNFFENFWSLVIGVKRSNLAQNSGFLKIS